MRKSRRLPSPPTSVRGFARPSVAAEASRAPASAPAAAARDLAFELRMAEHQLNEARAEIVRLRELAYVNPQDESPAPATWKEQAQTLAARLSLHESGGTKALEFEWLQDSHDCETCGFSCAEGAVVRLNGQVLLERQPCAGCFDDRSYSSDVVHHEVLLALGYEVTQHTADLGGQDPLEDEISEGVEPGAQASPEGSGAHAG